MARFLVARAGAAACQIPPCGALFDSARAALVQYLSAITGAPCFDAPASARVVFRAVDHGLSGFARRLEGNNLVLAAEAARYAVYDLLEQLAGCRFYTSAVEKVPRDLDLALEVTDYTAHPILEFRELYYRDYGDETFAAKRKTHPFERHAGWGFWCHSFGKLLPAKEYFDDHPEYYALIDGQRHPRGQLCLTNPDVLEIVTDNLRKYMAMLPDRLYWSVSQDDHANYCRCPDCEALNEADGTPMGSVLTFVNKIAGRFPDKIISTLAYWYTRKAPLHTRPAPNVHIMLCNIEALRGEPLTEDPRNAGTVQELRDWAAICGKVFLWDYNIQFANLVSPFPNLSTLAPNIRFFVENSVRSLFSQCNREIGGEMCELRGYMLSKLMWDPYVDPRTVMEDFVQGYYGAAAPHIQHYIDTLHAASHKSGAPLGIFHGPANARESYLTPELCAGYDADFDAAETAAADDPEVLARVRTARLPLIYAQLVLRYLSREERLQKTAYFARVARNTQLKMVEEWHIAVDQFLTDTLAGLAGERLEFGRFRMGARTLLGKLIDGTAVEFISSNQDMAMQYQSWLELPEKMQDIRVYSQKQEGKTFVGLPMRPDACQTLPEGLVSLNLPERNYITVTCEAADADLALEALPQYLKDHGRLSMGEPLFEYTLTGGLIIFCPVRPDGRAGKKNG